MRSFSNRYSKILPHYRDTPEKRYLKISILLIICVILVMIITVSVVFALSLRGPEEILVPDVCGSADLRYDLISAMNKLQEKGLYAKIQLKHSSSFKKGTVIDQRPRAGSIVKAGRRILLTVSEGPVINSVDGYVGKTLSTAQMELQEIFSGNAEALIRIKEPVMYIFNELPPGTILAQEPEPGTKVRESEITYLSFVVSKGPKGEHIKIPDYRSKQFSIVMEELSLSNIPFTFEIRPAEAGEMGGVIVSQEPAPGEEVLEKSVIKFTMTEPKVLDEGLVFGFFQADLPRYPILVTIELVERLENEQRTIVAMQHPGGQIVLPYVAREDADIVFFVNKSEWHR